MMEVGFLGGMTGDYLTAKIAKYAMKLPQNLPYKYFD